MARDLSDRYVPLTQSALGLRLQPDLDRPADGIQAAWLLDGRCRIIREDPIEVQPNTTGAEIVKVVRTLPIAPQKFNERDEN